MDITLLVSELNEIPSLSDPIRDLFNRNLAINEIESLENIEELIKLKQDISIESGKLSFTAVATSVMEIHFQVIKPYVSQSEDEDDFI